MIFKNREVKLFLKQKKAFQNRFLLHSSEIKNGFEKGLISVVLPVFNGEEYLKASINSVLSQTYRNFELIIVDDGSTDLSGEIADTTAKTDKRIKVIHQENLKLPTALNVGFSMAHGEFYTWTSADNIMLPAFLEVLSSELIKDPLTDMVFSNISLIDDVGNTLRGYGWYEFPPFSGNVILPDKTDRLNIIQNNTIGSAFMYRSGCHNILSGYDSSLFTLEDYDFFMKMNSVFKIKHTLASKPVYKYRFHKNSLTARDKELRITESRPKMFENDIRRRCSLLKPVYYYTDGDSSKYDAFLNKYFIKIRSEKMFKNLLNTKHRTLVYINFYNASKSLDTGDKVLKYLIVKSNEEKSTGFDFTLCEDIGCAENGAIFLKSPNDMLSYIFISAKMNSKNRRNYPKTLEIHSQKCYNQV